MVSEKDLTTSEKIKRIKYLLQNDREFFFEFMLGHYIKTPSKPVAELHRRWFKLLDIEQFLAVAAPREHAKSTIFTLADNLFDICNHGISVHQPYIIIISDTPEQAKEHLENIVEELEGNKLIHQWYGKLYEKRIVGDRKKDKWTSDTIVTTKNTKVQAVGWRFKGRGKRRKEERPSKIVVDDGENDEDVNSEKMREKLNTSFMKKVMSMGSKNTKFRFVGTILHFDSFLNNLIKKPPEDYKTFLYTAIKEDSTALWPEWWSLERLEKKKKRIGSINFAQEFMNDPLDESKSIIKRHWPQFYNGQYEVKAKQVFINGNQLEIITAIDPAISEKQKADYSALITVGYNSKGDVYVLNRTRDHLTISDQVGIIFGDYLTFNSDVVLLETKAYQLALYQEVRKQSGERKLYLPLHTVDPDVDKTRRVKSISSMFENKHVFIPEHFRDLYEEIIQFPLGGYDDMLDALTMCLQCIKYGETGVGHGNEDKQRKDEDLEMMTSGMKDTNF